MWYLIHLIYIVGCTFDMFDNLHRGRIYWKTLKIPKIKKRRIFWISFQGIPHFLKIT